MMEDIWCVAVGVFQVWMFVVVFLIMLPAMFGLSLGVTGVYIQILVKILEVTETGVFQISFCWSLVVCNAGSLSLGELLVPPYLICLYSYEISNRRHQRSSENNFIYSGPQYGSREEGRSSPVCLCLCPTVSEFR